MKITIHQALEYEVKSSWLAPLIGWNWLAEIAGSYFAWKIKRKFKRYQWVNSQEEKR